MINRENREQLVVSLLAELRQDIIQRRINSGFERLEAQASLLETICGESTSAPQLVWRIAQWVDIGWRDASLIAELLRRIPTARGNLSLRDYAAIRMAEGVVAMELEEPDEAIRHFDAVLVFRQDLGDPEILSIANFWKARCQRQKGEYDQALANASTAQNLALQCGFDRMAAVMRVLESWLLFQKGRLKDALKILGETEAILRATGDAVVLGNIQSTYGRIYRQEGRYDQAVLHFTTALEEYRKLDRRHPNLARTLANLGYSKRLVALELRRKIDADLARRRRFSALAAVDSPVDYREQFARLRDEAFAHLDEAEAVYAVHPNHHGAGVVHLNRGLLHYDNGALDLAEVEAAGAFALGEEKQDLILMARARILQTMVENAKVEEGIDEDPRRHAQAALDYSRDAIEFARRTQNRRLLGRAHTWHGLTLANEFFNSPDPAMEALTTASSYLDHGFHDTAWEDLRVLRARLTKAHNVDTTLQAWSQGVIGDRTYRQISDEFAAILIPKVWEMEERKIARVATRLAISPKKVRRILARAGLLQAASSG